MAEETRERKGVVWGRAGSKCSNNVICHRLGSFVKEPVTKACSLFGTALKREWGELSERCTNELPGTMGNWSVCFSRLSFPETKRDALIHRFCLPFIKYDPMGVDSSYIYGLHMWVLGRFHRCPTGKKPQGKKWTPCRFREALWWQTLSGCFCMRLVKACTKLLSVTVDGVRTEAKRIPCGS